MTAHRELTAAAGDRFIVAEISKNWIAGYSPAPLLLSQQFETAINHNWARGYRLVSFELHRLIVGPDNMNETIIAVFEQVEAPTS
jgi:hypothetical protein